jgi:HlyD family secretion protein
MKLLSIVLSLLILSACSSDKNGAIQATGTIEAQEVTVSTQVNGIIKELRVDEGGNVNAGDTIALIDPVDWLLQLNQAYAALQVADAQYTLAFKGARQEDVVQAEANLKSADADQARMRELRKQEVVSQKQLEDAETRFTLAKQTLEKLKRGSREEEIQMAVARRSQAASLVQSFRKKVSDCAIVAPSAGTVTKRFIRRGELAGPGTAIARLGNLAEMELMIYLPESKLPEVKLNQAVDVSVDAFKEKTFPGRVVFISSVAEFTPKNIQTKEERTKLVFGVKIAVANPDGALKAGLPADVTLKTQQ